MTRLKAFLITAVRSLARARCGLLIGLTVACLVIKEQYPFSNFPMYSSFTNRTYYVHLADGNDQPLPSIPTIGMSTPTLKKVYDGEVRRQTRQLQIRRQQLTPEQKQAIGGPILERLKNTANAHAPGQPIPDVLRLYQVDIELTDGRFEKRRTLIAELR